MHMPHALIFAGLTVLGLNACQGDETVTAYGAADITWELSEIDGQHYSSQATLVFPEPGRIAGHSQCNSYTAVMDAPYPWFEAQHLSVTEMACADHIAESLFLQALQSMTLSEVAGDVLLLSNVQGREMIFIAAE